MSAVPALTVDGLTLRIDGAEGPVVLMLHGWPDGPSLWDGAVAALAPSLRCVRLTLPGFDRHAGPPAMGLDAMTALLRRIVVAVSPDRPVSLLLHDWGCVFGYELAARHPELVARIVAVDVGDHHSPELARELSAKARRGIFVYQAWLALAWLVGGRIGDRMTRAMARRLRCPTLNDAVGCHMNYPYAMQWLGALGGLRRALPVGPAQPLLYVYGQRKPFMFHSRAWLDRLAQRDDCRVQPMATGHWVMVQAPEAFATCVRDWLLAQPARDQAPCLPGTQP